jgi:acyl-homoserine lactone acylase PvdQ
MLGPLFNPPRVELGGAPTSANVLSRTPTSEVEGPSMRFSADLADPDNTRLVNFMGQSGHMAIPHDADQLDAWVNVRSQKLAFTPAAVAREAKHTLILVP